MIKLKKAPSFIGYINDIVSSHFTGLCFLTISGSPGCNINNITCLVSYKCSFDSSLSLDVNLFNNKTSNICKKKKKNFIWYNIWTEFY